MEQLGDISPTNGLAKFCSLISLAPEGHFPSNAQAVYSYRGRSPGNHYLYRLES
jgi:hypothetical protein